MTVSEPPHTLSPSRALLLGPRSSEDTRLTLTGEEMRGGSVMVCTPDMNTTLADGSPLKYTKKCPKIDFGHPCSLFGADERAWSPSATPELLP